MTTLVRAIAALGLVFVASLLGQSKSRDDVAQAPLVRFALRYPWLTVGGMATGALIVAAIVVGTGIVPIKASSGHWRITEMLLDYAKVRSISTYSLRIEAPPLDDDAAILRGAAQYENACLPCHGGPGRRLPPVMAAMTPRPPELSDRLTRWTPEQLFTIVKHGIKFTGMPGWPTQERDDEVWAMVAFLRRMPQLDGDAYRRLVFGDTSRSTDAPPALSSTESQPALVVRAVCSRCHGADGTGRGPGAFPSLAGQRPEYLHASLRAFADRSRSSGIMSAIAANLSDADMRAASDYYGRMAPREGESRAELPSIKRGAALASLGVPTRDIPACVECHGPTEQPKNATYPTLAGQHAGYLAQQLRLFQARRRGGSPNVTLMHAFVDRLRPDDVRDVAVYYGSGARKGS
jgi:cytochrome c553